MISPIKQRIKHPTVVALAQARKSSPSERPSRLGSLERGSNSGQK